MTIELTAGQVVGGYELVEKAGAGGFCVVWRARRAEPGREPRRVRGSAPASDASGVGEANFALKLPLVADFTDHLRHEAVLHARVRDPQVVEVLEAHLDHDPPHLVMPWVEGRTLPLPAAPAEPARIVDAFEVVRSAARVVARLHESGIVHGDLKPGNLLLGKDGKVHVLDLGLARIQLKTRRDRSLAQSLVSVDGKSIGGTLEFMAPEVLGGADPRPATDVYALGVILHWMLCGRPPAFGVRPESLNPYLPPGTEDLLRRMLHQDPAVRARDAGAVISELGYLVEAERACLARKNGHERRRVFEARMATVRRGFRAMLVVLALPVLVWGGVAAAESSGPVRAVVPLELLAVFAAMGGVGLGCMALLLGITTINAWILRVPEKTYKNRTGHPIWSFMMQ